MRIASILNRFVLNCEYYEIINNIQSNLVKSPKVFVRDSGLLHSLLEIESHDNLLGHPVYGSAWEGFVVENIIAELPRWRPFYFKTDSFQGSDA